MTNFSIQIAVLTAADFANAYQLELTSNPFPLKRKLFFSNQGENYCNFKLLIDSKMIGAIFFQVVLDEASLMHLIVEKAHQKSGYGGQLLQHALQILTTAHIKNFWLEVRVSNHHAITLYEKNGFSRQGRRVAYYSLPNGKSEDALIMHALR